MQYYNNQLGVEARFLLDNGIMSEACLRQLTHRGDMKILRRGCKDTPSIYAYDHTPDRFKLEILKIENNPHQAASISQLEEHIMHNTEASTLFENFRLPDGRYLKQDTRREYYANAIVLDGIHSMIISKKGKRRAQGHNTKRSWDEICKLVMDLDRVKYPHNLPANPRRLEERYKIYKQQGPQCLIHKNFMNKSAAKVDDAPKEAFLMQLIGDPRNLDNEQVKGLYNQVAEKMNWKVITSGTVGTWRDKMDLETHASRRGLVSFSNKKAMQVKRSAPTAPLYFLTIDGWDVELLYQKTERDKHGRTGTTYHNRPTLVVALDPCLKYPLGYAIGTHENPELIKAALRDASRHTQQLFGEMFKAHQIQSDRYAPKTMAPYYSAIAEKSTPARAHNAKAKVIEPYWNYLNKTYCQLMPNWSGFNITSNPENQPNNEFINKYRHDFPDYDMVCKQVQNIIMRERASKVQAYVEAWGNMNHEDRIPMSVENYLLWFGDKTGHTNMLVGSGLHPTICGIRRDYDCFDLSFRDHYSTKWEVLYDPCDLSRALAVNEDQSLRYLLEEKYVQPMALKDRKPGDSDQLQRVREYNKALEEKVIDTRARAAELVRETLQANPSLEETTLRKLLITDSRGQHKNRLAEARMAKQLTGGQGGQLGQLGHEDDENSIYDMM